MSSFATPQVEMLSSENEKQPSPLSLLRKLHALCDDKTSTNKDILDVLQTLRKEDMVCRRKETVISGLTDNLSKYDTNWCSYINPRVMRDFICEALNEQAGDGNLPKETIIVNTDTDMFKLQIVAYETRGAFKADKDNTPMVFSYGFHVKIMGTKDLRYKSIGYCNASNEKWDPDNIVWGYAPQAQNPSWVSGGNKKGIITDTMLITLKYSNGKWGYTSYNTMYPTNSIHFTSYKEISFMSRYPHVVSGDLFCPMNKIMQSVKEGVTCEDIFSKTLKLNMKHRLEKNYLPHKNGKVFVNHCSL